MQSEQKRLTSMGQVKKTVYDEDVKFLSHIPEVGSLDRYGTEYNKNWYGVSSKHVEYDVSTYKLADKLGYVRSYYEVRPKIKSK